MGQVAGTIPDQPPVEDSCARKNRYSTEALAQKVANRNSYKTRGRIRLRVYPCFHCGGWHITKREQA